MNELLKKIYKEVLVYEHDVVKTNKHVDEEINQLVAQVDKLNQMVAEMEGLISE